MSRVIASYPLEHVQMEQFVTETQFVVTLMDDTHVNVKLDMLAMEKSVELIEISMDGLMLIWNVLVSCVGKTIVHLSQIQDKRTLTMMELEMFVIWVRDACST